MCKITAAQVIADGQAVGTALENLAAAIQSTDPSLATKLNAAGNALIAATSNWKDGDSLTILEDAEQAAIVVLDAIPLTSPFADLVAIAFTALNLLIANSKTQPAQTGGSTASIRTVLKMEAETNADSHWHGEAKINHNPLHSLRVNFENTWNEKAKPLGVREVYV